MPTTNHLAKVAEVTASDVDLCLALALRLWNMLTTLVTAGNLTRKTGAAHQVQKQIVAASVLRTQCLSFIGAPKILQQSEFTAVD